MPPSFPPPQFFTCLKEALATPPCSGPRRPFLTQPTHTQTQRRCRPGLGFFFFSPTVPQKQTAFVNFELFLLGVFYDGERLVPSEDEKSLKKWQSPVCRC